MVLYPDVADIQCDQIRQFPKVFCDQRSSPNIWSFYNINNSQTFTQWTLAKRTEITNSNK